MYFLLVSVWTGILVFGWFGLDRQICTYVAFGLDRRTCICRLRIGRALLFLWWLLTGQAYLCVCSFRAGQAHLSLLASDWTGIPGFLVASDWPRTLVFFGTGQSYLYDCSFRVGQAYLYSFARTGHACLFFCWLLTGHTHLCFWGAWTSMLVFL